MSKREERRLARRYWHEVPWRPCYRATKRPCLRCFWREITGINTRQREMTLSRSHFRTSVLPPIPYRRNDDGTWRRVDGK